MLVKVGKHTAQTLLDYLREQHIWLDAPCNGNKTCKKCKVHIKEPGEEVFVEKLACDVACVEGQEVRVPNRESFESVATDYQTSQRVKKDGWGVQSEKSYGIAIDIGTTTIALALVDQEDEQVVGTYTLLNSGRTCGADVISRIHYSNTHGPTYLQQLLYGDIQEGIRYFEKEYHLKPIQIAQVIVVGNTTMLHLLKGVSCETLGVYPFKSVFKGKQVIPLATIMNESMYHSKVYLLPSIATYVGSDIVSGISQVKMGVSEKVNLLIDIGTNGEIVLGNKERLLCLATAAGPAFEGGNITCGTGSIAGAISEAVLVEGSFKVQTIGDVAPKGICGSGLIAIVGELLKNGWIDETGRLEDDYGDEVCIVDVGDIKLTQKDIREFQLAKAAMRAGIQVLLETYGIGISEVDKIYLAGGFGQFIAIQYATALGLLPNVEETKFAKVGNVALGGAISYLLRTEVGCEVEQFLKVCEEVRLEGSKFNQYFVEYMAFE